MALKETVQNFIREVLGREKGRQENSKVDDMMGKLPSHLSFLVGGGISDIAKYLQMEDDIKSRYMDYEDMDDLPELSAALDIYCLTGDTLVHTLAGPVSIRELAERGGEHLVYSYDVESQSVVVGRAVNARLTIKKAEVWRIVLDNGRVIRATANHPFMMRDGNYTRVDHLKPGDEVMPFSSRLGRAGYLEVFQPGWMVGDTKRWQPNYQIVGRFKYGRGTRRNEHVHHSDFDKLNDVLENIEYLTREQHAAKHSAQGGHAVVWTDGMRKQQALRMRGNQYSKGNVLSSETRARMGAAHRGTVQSEEWVQKRTDVRRIDQPMMMSIRCLAEQGKRPSEISKTVGCSWSTAMRYSRGGGGYNLDRLLVNHRVLRIERAGNEDVYDLEVPQYHNFAVEGIFVHNSDDSTQPQVVSGESLWVEGQNQELVDDLNNMLHQRVGVEDELWGIVRNMNKYGNDFEELLVKDGEGVIGLNFMPTPLVRAIVDRTWTTLGYKYHPEGKFSKTSEEDFKAYLEKRKIAPVGEVIFEDWEVAHFKLGSRRRWDVYGTSVLEAARWIWRRLVLLEDSMLIYRLTRAASRFVFFVDIGDKSGAEAWKHLNNVKNEFKKKKFVNTSGHLDMRYNPLANDEDIFIPVRGGKRSAEIETLQGPIYGAIDDVEYFKDKLYAAIKIPKSYLGFEEDVSAKALLSQEDIRFSRTILRIQREIRNGFRRICKVHLAAKGIDPADVDFDVMMTIPSAIFEQAYLQVLQARAEVADKMKDFVSMPWLLKEIFHFSEAEIAEMERQRAQADADGGPTFDLSNVPSDAGIPVEVPMGSDINQQVLQALKSAGLSTKKIMSDRITLGLAKDKLDKSLRSLYGKQDGKRMEQKMDSLLKHDQGLAKRLDALQSLLTELKHGMAVKKHQEHYTH